MSAESFVRDLLKSGSADRYLSHMVDYNPVYAHEYYLRTRQLHPRQPSAKPAPAPARAPAKPVTAAPQKAVAVKPVVKKPVVMSAAQLQQQANLRVKELQAKLHLLESKLRQLIAKHNAAKARAAANKANPHHKTLTAVQKAQAKQRALKRKAAGKVVHKPGMHSQTLASQITTVQNQIVSIKKQLTAAIAKARTAANAALKKIP